METKDVFILLLGGMLALLVNLCTPAAMSLVLGSHKLVIQRSKKRAIKEYKIVRKLHNNVPGAHLYFVQMWAIIVIIWVGAIYLLLIGLLAAKFQWGGTFLPFQIASRVAYLQQWGGALGLFAAFAIALKLQRWREKLHSFQQYREQLVSRFGSIIDDGDDNDVKLPIY